MHVFDLCRLAFFPRLATGLCNLCMHHAPVRQLPRNVLAHVGGVQTDILHQPQKNVQTLA